VQRKAYFSRDEMNFVRISFIYHPIFLIFGIRDLNIRLLNTASFMEIGKIRAPLKGPVAQLVQRLSYGLEGPGSNSGGDEIFLPSRQALRPTHPPVKWVSDLSRG